MADGNIKITIEVDGKQINIAADSLESLGNSAKATSNNLKGAEGDLKEVGTQSKKGSTSIKDMAVSLGLVKVASAAFNVLKSSLDSAISRFDTLNKYPKVLQSLGVSAEDSEKSISRLSDGIDGLPTTLDNIASSAQQLYMSFGDIDQATETAVGLNNAFLASGASAADAKRGMDQYVQMLNAGKPDMQSWKSLQDTMPLALQKTAEAMGFTGKAAKQDLYEALKNGERTFDEFNASITELGTGTGELAKLARENSLGIATSLSNLKNSAVRGLTTVLNAFNNMAKEVTGKDLAGNIDGLKNIINASFKVIGKVIEGTTPIVGGFAGGIKATIPVVKALTPVLAGLFAIYASHAVIEKASSALEKSKKIIEVAKASTTGLTLATTAKTKAQLADTTVTTAGTVAATAQAGAVKLSTLAMGVLTGSISAKTAVEVISTAASYALGAAIKFMLGPIGWVTAGIGLLVAGATALVKWFNRSTEAGKELTKEAENLNEANNTLIDSVDQTSKSYEKNISSIEASAEANKDLASRIGELSEKENKSAADKELLSSYVEQLNEQVEGLNLAYSEEADAMNLSAEQIQARLDLMKEQEAGMAAQERLLEISKEQTEVDKQLEETNRLREEAAALRENEDITKKELKKTNEELNETEAELEERKKSLREEYIATEEQLTATMENIANATEDSVGKQTILYDSLSDAQKTTVDNMKASWEDYKESATDMFDTLSDKVTITASEMADNLEENQRIISKWSENIAKLADRGVDEGLLETLRAAGPSSAGHVNALVNASDKELERLSTAFSEGGDVATDALSKSLGIEESGVLDAVGHLVTDTESSLKEQVKSADFSGIGKDVADGMAEGVKDGSKKAINASGDMATDMTRRTKQELQSHSPSKVFKNIGIDVTDGLALGINTGTIKVTQALERLFRAMQTDTTRSFSNLVNDMEKSVNNMSTSLDRLNPITQSAMQSMLNRLRTGSNEQTSLMRSTSSQLVSPFNNMESQFRSIGANAMAGLNRGLSNNRSRVMSTARAIADQVASTMRRALRINSPSKVMEDDVGRWIPEGLAVGIKDNAKSVYSELDKLSYNMSSITPEMAVGAPRMAYTNPNSIVTGHAVNNNSVTENDNGVLVTGNTFIVRGEPDIEKIARKIEERRRMQSRGRLGVVTT